MDDLIHLNPSKQIAKGGERIVFAHPDDPTRIIKVHKDLAAKANEGKARSPDSGIPFAKHHWGVIRQYDEYNRLWLWRRYDPDFRLPISHLYGFVKTNLGLGGISERVMDADGASGGNFAELAKQDAVTDHLLAQFNDLVQRLYAQGVCMSDTNPANFVYGYRAIAGAGQTIGPEWVMVDGFGDRFTVPVRTWFRYVRQKGADESFARKFQPKGFVWDNATRQVRRA